MEKSRRSDSQTIVWLQLLFLYHSQQTLWVWNIFTFAITPSLTNHIKWLSCHLVEETEWKIYSLGHTQCLSILVTILNNLFVASLLGSYSKAGCYVVLSGYCCQFDTYSGAEQKQQETNLPLDSKNIFDLLQAVENPDDHKAFFDIYFSSHSLNGTASGHGI